MTITEDGTLSSFADERLRDCGIRDMRLGNDGIVYGLTTTGDIFSIEDGAIACYLSQEESRVKGVMCLMPDSRKPGYVYLGTDNSQIYYGNLEKNFSTMEAQDISPLSYVEGFEYLDGHLWICAGNGIGVWDSRGFTLLKNLPMNERR